MKARDFPSGHARTGSDGRTWKVKVTVAGHKTWVPTPTRKASPRASRSSRPNAPSRRAAPAVKAARGATWGSLWSLAATALRDVHPSIKLSSSAAAALVKIVTPLARELARSSLRSALSSYYGHAKELIKHSISEATKHSTQEAQRRAVLYYLMCELVDLSGNHASYRGRVTVMPLDVMEAMRSDSE